MKSQKQYKTMMKAKKGSDNNKSFGMPNKQRGSKKPFKKNLPKE